MRRRSSGRSLSLRLLDSPRRCRPGSVDPAEGETSASAASALEAASFQEGRIENREAPWIDPSAIAITRGDVPGTWHIEVPPTAVFDPDGIAEIRLAGARSWTSAKLSPQTGATFTWLGPAGEPLELIAIDAHPLLQLGAHACLEPLPETGSLVAAEALPRNEPQPRLASGNGYLLAAYTDRLVVADHRPPFHRERGRPAKTSMRVFWAGGGAPLPVGGGAMGEGSGVRSGGGTLAGEEPEISGGCSS